MSSSASTRAPGNSSSRKTRRRNLLVVLAVVGVAAIAGVLLTTGGATEAQLVYYPLQRGDLEISVTERGNLEAQEQTQILCEVEDIRGDSIRGVPIIWVIPNGSSVDKGDLLVELDSASLQEELDEQSLDTAAARSDLIQAEVKFENQKTQNKTNMAEAKLQVKLAELAVQQFEDEEGGTFQIDLQNVELQIQEAQAGKLIEETNLQGVEQLYELGYRSRGELAQARLSAMQSERQLATAISQKKELVDYTYRKQKLELEGALESAKRNLEQVKRDNEALLAQAKAVLDNAKEDFHREDERLKRYKEQLEKCKIHAPHAGLVAYATDSDGWRREEIREGAAIRYRQTILTIPELDKMQVRTAVHESVLDQMEAGLPVTVRVDAFPGNTYTGSVQSVALLPDEDALASSDTKVYETVVTIDEEVEKLKPGMTAVAEIHVDHLEDIISVPVQAVMQVKNDTWCYVDSGRGPERRPVELGSTNLKYVEVKSGIEEGERVVLNPEAIFEESEEKEDEADDKGGTQDEDEEEKTEGEDPRQEDQRDPSRHPPDERRGPERPDGRGEGRPDPSDFAQEGRRGPRRSRTSANPSSSAGGGGGGPGRPE